MNTQRQLAKIEKKMIELELLLSKTEHGTEKHKKKIDELIMLLKVLKSDL